MRNPKDDDLRTVEPEVAAGWMGWSLKTLERKSASGEGPRIIRISAKKRRVVVGEIRGFLKKRAEAPDAA